jgi:hypothetical protein
MRVLIVEDEALIAMYLKMLVTELGYEVCACTASGGPPGGGGGAPPPPTAQIRSNLSSRVTSETMTRVWVARDRNRSRDLRWSLS